MSTLVEKAQARVRERRAQEAADGRGLGQRLSARTPALLRWRLPSPGDIVPITDDEAFRCGAKVEGALSKAIRIKLSQRTIQEAADAWQAWANVRAPNRSKGSLSMPIPVKWQGDPEPDDDIPF